MLSGDLPFGEDPGMICSGEPPDFTTDVWKSVSEDAVDLISKLLNPDVQDRWTAQQALQHAWVARARRDRVLPGVDAQNLQEGLSDEDLADPTTVRLESHHELAGFLLRSLRRWRRLNKLRRIVITAIAKRLEAHHPSQRLAKIMYCEFNPSSHRLRCDQLVQTLNNARCDAMSATSAAAFASLTELKYLVTALDGMKNGMVDY